jgi:CIC family chloride channel protein
MMRREVRTVRTDMPLSSFKRDYPLGATTQVVVVDDAERYKGLVLVSEAHAAAEEGNPKVGSILHDCGVALVPQMTIKEAVEQFEAAESDALAVVDSRETGRVIGLLTEQYALRRYSDELDKRRRELSGEL